MDTVVLTNRTIINKKEYNNQELLFIASDKRKIIAMSKLRQQ